MSHNAVNESVKGSGSRWQQVVIHLFPLPALVIYSVVIVYSMVAAFGYSFFSWKGLTRDAFVGLDNFVTLFTQEPYNETFWNALGHNAYYFALEMVVQNGIAFMLAYVLYTKVKGAEWFKSAIFLPRLLSVIVIGFLWKLILNPNTGVLNTFLKTIGLDSWAMSWLGDPDTALTSIIMVNNWFGVGFSLLIWLAGLQAIPAEIVEAARLEGVKGLKFIRMIVAPLIVPSFVIITVFSFIHAFEAFELVYAMQGSQGEPYMSTDTLATYFYRNAFGGTSGGDSVSIGLGSALAVIMFAIISVVSTVFMNVTRKYEVEL
ncbi:raffinose/stachyose/melibiose transport system permease protein [Paenibacillus phyllosphaerae]|uniref:Raffinose/stachyose/melibiose transport system permease protein n=1 Tax=Paenibacillus phyllosphaerae TaxID=274593 RepID=A0A7W5AZ86_9BACL|nr:sugar ABC transporter permease [Paenibacillus phyllosphaerae]MBB3111458.1 raffinose/stachyose/melibiose transport system permease protein [Paenibacillus phyllosphaerae]